MYVSQISFPSLSCINMKIDAFLSFLVFEKCLLNISLNILVFKNLSSRKQRWWLLKSSPEVKFGKYMMLWLLLRTVLTGFSDYIMGCWFLMLPTLRSWRV